MKNEDEVKQLKERVERLEELVRGQQNALKLAGEALAGHQRILQSLQPRHAPVAEPLTPKVPPMVH